ncbi:Zinc knuckle CX2CX4HX4C [Trema orientale]|uniref:Zinc knuckle CX2CX4HX4C n=1 Tax=Trema orientale TaxID=63057 RepID=A0A2P5FJN2_TREOI|nr:Zinc knuckle CX2CX4HX4C [Trema orientale]
MKPLRRGIHDSIDGLEREVPLILRYEHLLDFCFNCDMIGHRARECINYQEDIFCSRAPKRNAPVSSIANFDIGDGDSGPDKDRNSYFNEIRELEDDMEVYGVNSAEELVKLKDSEEASGKDLPPVIVPHEGTHLTDEERERIIRRAEFILLLVKGKKGKVDTGISF